MECYHPLTLTLRGERGREQMVPCGQCIGCRLERSRQWAVRLVHENKLHRESCFVTLTYDDEHLPVGGSLVPEDLRLFVKRVRNYAKPGRVRFFACGEYGEHLSRPHYHAILFGVRFPASGAVSSSGGYRSDSLSALWPYGFAFCGAVSFESAAYVARYVVKKVTGGEDVVKGHYGLRVPEFVRMSRRPGIGQGFFLSTVRIFIRATRLWCEVRWRSLRGTMTSCLMLQMQRASSA